MSGVAPPQRTLASAPASFTARSCASSPGHTSRKTRAGASRTASARSSRASTSSTRRPSRSGSAATSSTTLSGGAKSSGMRSSWEAGTMNRFRIHASGVARAQASTSSAASIGQLRRREQRRVVDQPR